MKRTFNLNSGWIYFETSALIPAEKLQKGEKVQLPHVVDYFGQPWFSCIYQKEIPIPTALRQREMWLEFEGVAGKADVYIGQELCHSHRGSFTSFRCNITPFIECDTVALVSVVVSADESESHDVFFSAGIYGKVSLHIADKSRFSFKDFGSDGIYIDTRIHEGFGLLSVEALIDSPINYDVLTYEVRDLDENVVAMVKTHPRAARANITVGDVKAWSVENPYLYTLTCTLVRDGKMLDASQIKFGFTHFSTEKSEFRLNGEPIKLNGFGVDRNRPELGYVDDNSLNYTDICRVKELGANFVWLHQNHSDEYYTYLDELGLLSGINIDERITADMTDDEFELMKTRVSEIVRQTYNHPSVVLIKLGNIQKGNDGELLVERANELYECIREFDKKRCLFFGGDISDETTSDIIFVEKDSDFAFVDDISGQLSEHKDADKPVFLTFGMPALSKHCEMFTRGDMSLEYRHHFFEQVINMLKYKPFVCAVAVESLNEYKTGSVDNYERINHCGLINTESELADVAFICKRNFSDDDFVHICSIDFSRREPVLKIYSSRDEIQVILNDKENKPIKKTSANGVFVFEGLKIREKTKITVI